MNNLELLANEYSINAWENYAKCFDNVNVSVEGVPQDMVNAVITILGAEAGIKWLDTPFSIFDGKTAMELLSIENGEKALKALIMRLPN